jgi:rRNA maturation endonuclease Nob1
MIYSASATFSKHSENDWCHLCGGRRHATVDIHYARNAEYPDGSQPNYVRVCTGCAHSVLRVASEPDE